MGDANLSVWLSGVDFAAKEVKYDGYCRIKYQTEAEGKYNQEKHMAGEGCIPETSASIWHLNQEIHKKYLKPCVVIYKKLLLKTKTIMLTNVNNYYCHLLHEFQRNT